MNFFNKEFRKISLENIDKSNIYPRDDRYNSAIYDSSKKKIFSIFAKSSWAMSS